MDCLNCSKNMEIEDTTYSNINNSRVSKGDRTGDIYWCEQCQIYWIDNFISGKVEVWNY